MPRGPFASSLAHRSAQALSGRKAALLELLLLAGFYRTVSYLTNALRLPREPFARFPA